MCVFLCMGGNSTTWMNTAVLVTCIRNFRRNRGPVSGILKGFVGLSTAIFTDLCSALFTDDPASFILMLAVVPLVICAIAMIFLRETPPLSVCAGDDTENRYFGWINAAAVVIAIYLLVFDLTGDHGVIISRFFSAGLIFLIASPAILPAFLWFKERSSSLRVPDSVLEAVESQIQEPLLSVDNSEEKSFPREAVENGQETKRMQRRVEIGEDHTIWEAMRRMEFWVLFVSFLCGVGTGMAVMNNMGQMGLAMGYSDVSIFVSLTSIWGFFGRIASGSISEHFLKYSSISIFWRD